MDPCRVCLQPRARQFRRDGVCEECDPTAGPEPREAYGPTWDLAHVLALTRAYRVAGGEWTDFTPHTIREMFLHRQFPATLPGADDCAAWIAGLMRRPEHECTEYENALVLLLRQGYLRDDQFALAVGAYRTWEATQVSKDAPVVDPPTGQWLGTIKERRTIPGCQCTEIKPLGVNPDHPEWGARFLIRFTAASGHEIVWFASEGGLFDPKVGETYDVVATVTKHDEWQGRRSTIVNRCADANAPTRTRKAKDHES